MPVPDYETLMRPFLAAIDGGARNVSEALPSLKKCFEISEAEAEEMLPSGRITLLSSRTHWARTYLANAGCLSSPKRNVHLITERGKMLLRNHPVRIDNTVLGQFPEFLAWRTKASNLEPSPSIAIEKDRIAFESPSGQTPEDVVDTAYETIEKVLVSDLLQAVYSLNPTRFEHLIVDLLLAMGYGGGDRSMGERLGKPGDGGIDGIINEDALGLDAVYIQAKRYAQDSKVGRPALQAFVGSLTGEGATKGVFVTTSDFSREARDYLNKVQHRIVLVNGDRLARLMIQHEVGVRARKTYVLRSVDEDYFSDF
jgi:restriction system protein